MTTSTTAPYIFVGNSFFGPDITIYGDPNVPGQTIAASDLYATPGGSVSLASGASVGLGEVLFDVTSAASPGSFSVDFTGGNGVANSLSDDSGNNVTIDNLNSGSITAVPEPSTLVVATGTLVLAGIGSFWARRRSSTVA